MSNNTNPEEFKETKFTNLNKDDLFNILKVIAYDKETSRNFASINKNTNQVYKEKINIAKISVKVTYDPKNIATAFAEKVLIKPDLLLDYLFKYYNYNPHQQEQFGDKNIEYFNNLRTLYNEKKFNEIKNKIKDETIINNISDFKVNISKVKEIEENDAISISDNNFNKIVTLLSSINEKVRNKIKVKYTFNITNTYDNLLYYLKSDKKQYDNDHEIVLSFDDNALDLFTLFNTFTDLKKDKKFILIAVKQNGSALQYASKEFKKDKKFVLEVVKQNTEAFFFADESLKRNKQFIKELINTTNNKDSNKRIIDYSTLSIINKLHLKSINLIGERATKVLIFVAIITIAIPIICTLIALGLNRDTIREISKSVKNLEIQENVANFTKSFG